MNICVRSNFRFFDQQLFIPCLKTNPRTQLSPIAQSPRSNEEKIIHDLENTQKHDEELMHSTTVSEDHSDQLNQFENLSETDQVKIDTLTNRHQVDEGKKKDFLFKCSD